MLGLLLLALAFLLPLRSDAGDEPSPSTQEDTLTVYDRYHEGLFQESVEGDLKVAITIYTEVVREAVTDRDLAALCQFRIGLCYEMLGELEKSIEAYRKALDRYGDAEEVRQHVERGLSRVESERRSRETLLHPDEAGQSMIYQPGGGRIAGVVQDVEGGPVSDAHVQIGGITLPNGLFVYLKDGPELEADEDGTYELDELREGEYVLRFWSDGLGGRGQTDRAVPGKGPVRMTLGLTGSISGCVRDGEGRPIPGAEVSTMIGLYDPLPGGPYAEEHRCVADKRGRYLLKDLPYQFGDSDEIPWTFEYPTQRVWMMVCAQGYVTSQKGVRLRYSERKAGVDFMLDSGGMPISGVIRDASGMSISGARIHIAGWESWGNTMSEEGGLFEVDGLTAGTFTVVASAGGFAPKVIAGVSGGTDDLQITLGQGGAVSGRVMESIPDAHSSRPLEDVVVWAWHQREIQLSRSSLTDENGIYRIPSLAEGPYRISVASSRSPSVRGRLVSFQEKDVEVKEGQVAAGVDFYLRRGITVSGRLTYRDTGQPAGKVKVTLQGRNRMDIVTDEEGRYRFEGVAPGEYCLQTDLGGYAEVPYRRKVNVQGIFGSENIEGMDIQLVRRASLSVRAMDEQGRPVPDAEVRYMTPDQRTDENGECTYEAVRPEWPYPLMVDHPDHTFAFVDSLVLVPGEDRRMTFVLSSGGTLEGTITNWRGERVPNARITVCLADSGFPFYWYRRFGRIMHADETGHYRAEHLPQGLLRLLVDHEDPIFAPLEGTVHSGGDGSVTRKDIPVLRGGVVTGRVTDAEGRPVEGIRVYFDPWRYPWKVLTDAEGWYRAEYVPSGEYEVTTSGYYEDERKEKKRVVVEDGGAVTVDLVAGGG